MLVVVADTSVLVVADSSGPEGRGSTTDWRPRRRCPGGGQGGDGRQRGRGEGKVGLRYRADPAEVGQFGQLAGRQVGLKALVALRRKVAEVADIGGVVVVEETRQGDRVIGQAVGLDERAVWVVVVVVVMGSDCVGQVLPDAVELVIAAAVAVVAVGVAVNQAGTHH